MLGLLSTSMHIAAPPSAVFALLTDPARFPEWKTGVESIPELHGSLSESGGWYLAIMTTGGRKTPVRFVINEATAPVHHVQHGETVEGVRPGLETWARHDLVPVGEHTELRLTFSYNRPWGPVGVLLD